MNPKAVFTFTLKDVSSMVGKYLYEKEGYGALSSLKPSFDDDGKLIFTYEAYDTKGQ